MRFIQHLRRAAPLVVAVLLLTAQANPVRDATALINDGRYAEAQRMLAPLASSPDPEILYLLGRAAAGQNDNGKAADWFEKAIAKKPNDARYHYWLGRAYGEQAEKASIFRQASLAGKTRDEFERAVALDPNFVDAREALVDYYTQAPSIMGGSDAKAMQQAAEIKKRDPLEGHIAYAMIYARQKKPDLVRKEYVDAVREQPASARAHYLLAAQYIGVDRNYNAAQQELDTALKLDPKYMPAQFQVGHIAALTGANLPRGEESLKRYLGFHPGEDDPPLARAHYWLGMIYEREGKRPEAKQEYQTSLRMNSNQKDVAEALKRVQ